MGGHAFIVVLMAHNSRLGVASYRCFGSQCQTKELHWVTVLAQILEASERARDPWPWPNILFLFRAGAVDVFAVAAARKMLFKIVPKFSVASADLTWISVFFLLMIRLGTISVVGIVRHERP